jgi:hypothetical protein
VNVQNRKICALNWVYNLSFNTQSRYTKNKAKEGALGRSRRPFASKAAPNEQRCLPSGKEENSWNRERIGILFPVRREQQTDSSSFPARDNLRVWDDNAAHTDSI